MSWPLPIAVATSAIFLRYPADPPSPRERSTRAPQCAIWRCLDSSAICRMSDFSERSPAFQPARPGAGWPSAAAVKAGMFDLRLIMDISARVKPEIDELRGDLLRISAALKELSEAVDRGLLTAQRHGLRADQFGTMITDLHERLAQVEMKLP